MKKERRNYWIKPNPKVKNWLAIVIFLETSIISFRSFGVYVPAYILGMLLLISALYGIVCMFKGRRFIF